ncbi:MAG: peptidylprolyl isomerase [Bryobacterales bacterium]|nr:peptidylprolyl isomerase [Bryobacterales bacterium]MBV9397360.1 peptidylprolyl isomerase [Bryobacterales bacterium]
MRLVSALLLSSSLFAARVDVVDEIVCKVNGDIITRNDLEHDRKQVEEEIKRENLTGPRAQEVLNAQLADLLRNRIDRLLFVQKAKEMDLKVDTELNKRMADLQRRSGIADPQKFQDWVKEQAGMPYEDFRGDQRNGLLTDAVVREEIVRKINFKREELENYYNNHKSDYQRQERIFLRQILISTNGKDAAGMAAAEKKAKDVAARAKKGEKFPDLAQSNSDDTNTAQDGGALPPYEKGQLLPELEGAVWDQPRNYITDPIKIANGFIILKVDEHYKAGLASFDEVENEVQNKMLNDRLPPAERAYLTKLRESAFLQIKPGYVDSGAAPGKDTAWQDPGELKPETVTKEELAKTKHKKLLKIIPVPGTSTPNKGTSSSR